VFDILSQQYIAVEYDEAADQWYFINKDTRSHNWVATETVPLTFGLGIKVFHPKTVAADVDDSEAPSGQHQSSSQPGNSNRLDDMSMQTQTRMCGGCYDLDVSNGLTGQCVM
jgi:hypothetical protein